MTWPFENDTKAVIKKLADRSLEADRRRSIFVIITIALAVCLMGTLCFVYSGQRMQTLEQIQGHYQAGCTGISRGEMEELAAYGKFEKWGRTIDCGSVRYQDSVLNISFVDFGMIDLMDYGKITGSYPQAENELCVERMFLEYFSLPADTGQTITLNLGNGETAYTITGILETENSSRVFTAWIAEDAALTEGSLAPYELRFQFAGSQTGDSEQLRMDIQAFFEEMGISEDRTFYSSNYFDMAEIYLGNGLEIYVLAALIAIICGIVIYNIFYISVMGKLKEYGRLKVLGTTPRQLRLIVKRERRFLSTIAIPLGLLAAAAVTLILMPGYWAWSDNIKHGAIISVAAYGVVLIATRKPLELAGKVSAIEAVRAAAYLESQGPGVSRQLHRRLTMPRLALMNFSRNRKKTVVTTLSLSLTGILLLCVSAYANSVDAKEMAQSQFGDRSQYLLQYEDYVGQEFVDIQKENPLGRKLRDEIAAIPGVDFVTAYSLACVEIPAIWEQEPFIVREISEKQMSDLYTEDVVAKGTADYKKLVKENGILVCPAGDTLEMVYKTSYQVGDTITLSCYNGQTKTYTVMGIVDNVPIGCTSHFFILPEEELPVLYPEIIDFTGYLNVHAKEDGEELRQAVFGAATDKRVDVSGVEDMAAVLKDSLQQELKRDYGILVFIFVFSLINLANTLITNLLSRQQEFGIFQSVGMSDRQLSQMLSFECLYYVGITLLVTLTIGTLCSLAVCGVFDKIGTFGKITYHFPLIQVLLFGAALLLVWAVFSGCAVRYSGKLSLVERIKAAE